MDDIGNAILLEDGTGRLLLDDGSVILLDSAPSKTALNNYLAVRVGDGMGTVEKLR